MLDQLPQSTLPGSDELTLDEFFNPLSAEVIRDPYPTYHRLRAHDPVYWHRQLPAWVLTRHAERQSVLRDPERFAAERASGLLRELAGQGHFDFVRNFSDRFTMDAAYHALRAGAALESAVEELVRHSGPAHALSRACTEDLVIGDKKVKRGQRGGGAHQGRRPRPGPVRGPRYAATGPSAQSTPWVWPRLPFLPGRNGWLGRGKSDAIRARGRPADADPRRRSTAPPERDTARAVPASHSGGRLNSKFYAERGWMS
jgi:hypothetical protein